jgi:hypothetical protein
MQPRALAYFASHDRLTDPGEHAALLEGLPPDLPALHEAIQGVLIHVWRIRRDHPQLIDRRPHDVYTRHIRRLLAAALYLDPRPFVVTRPEETRAIVDCRHFATLLCAALRHRGVPARPRCGFATYLEETHLQDHWVCEYWDAGAERWVMEDADVGRHDVPPDQFVSGARAWRHCRDDPAAERFGFDPEQCGLWVVRMNLVRDFAALNGFPSVSGDAWGLALVEEAAVSAADVALLDQAAELASDDETIDARREFYATRDALRVPPAIQHFDDIAGTGWRTIEWAAAP